MRSRALIAAAAALVLFVGHSPVARAAKPVEPAQEAYFHLRQSIAFVEASEAGRCKDGYRLATTNLEESLRVSTAQEAEVPTNPLAAWQARASKILKDGKASSAEIKALAKEIRNYGDRIKYKAPKSWDSEITKHCSNAPF